MTGTDIQLKKSAGTLPQSDYRSVRDNLFFKALLKKNNMYQRVLVVSAYSGMTDKL